MKRATHRLLFTRSMPWALALTCAIAACEPMTPNASPFEAAAITGAATSKAPVSTTAVVNEGEASPKVGDDANTETDAGAGPAEWDFSERDEFVIDSSEMGSEGGTSVSNTEAGAQNDPVQAEDGARDDDASRRSTPSTAPTKTTGEQDDGWPLRLVSTVHQAQPPRAILGLPDGRELVVIPGEMLAEERLVILAIGDGIIQVAKIGANGDHAEIDSRTLTAQY